MSSLKTFAVWLVLCVACAAGTIAAIQVLDKQLGLQQKVARFGTK